MHVNAPRPAARRAFAPVAPCPGCRRRVFSRRDMLHAGLDGTMRCPACGETARLDLFGRWLLSSLIAIVLPGVLLYGDVFYSGHLFVVSMAVIFGAWRVLSFIALPYLGLEAVRGGSPVDRGTSVAIVAVLLLCASVIDGFMAARFEKPDPLDGRAAAAAQRKP